MVVLEFSINPCGCDTDTDSPAAWSWSLVGVGRCIRAAASCALVGDSPYSPKCFARCRVNLSTVGQHLSHTLQVQHKECLRFLRLHGLHGGGIARGGGGGIVSNAEKHTTTWSLNGK